MYKISWTTLGLALILTSSITTIAIRIPNIQAASERIGESTVDVNLGDQVFEADSGQLPGRCTLVFTDNFTTFQVNC